MTIPLTLKLEKHITYFVNNNKSCTAMMTLFVQFFKKIIQLQFDQFLLIHLQ